jgi:hypothetical protein
MADDHSRHWWNGKWGRLARCDVYLRMEDGRYVVEAREGGADGTTRTWQPPTEDYALELVDDLLSDQDSWREITATPPPPPPRR